MFSLSCRESMTKRSLTLRGNLHRSVAEHAAILRAAERGDAERAAHLMAEHVRVPDVRGDTQSAASAALQRAGLRVSSISYETSPQSADGIVGRMLPSERDQLRRRKRLHAD